MANKPPSNNLSLNNTPENDLKPPSGIINQFNFFGEALRIFQNEKLAENIGLECLSICGVIAFEQSKESSLGDKPVYLDEDKLKEIAGLGNVSEKKFHKYLDRCFESGYLKYKRGALCGKTKFQLLFPDEIKENTRRLEIVELEPDKKLNWEMGQIRELLISCLEVTGDEENFGEFSTLDLTRSVQKIMLGAMEESIKLSDSKRLRKVSINDSEHMRRIAKELFFNSQKDKLVRLFSIAVEINTMLKVNNFDSETTKSKTDIAKLLADLMMGFADFIPKKDVS